MTVLNLNANNHNQHGKIISFDLPSLGLASTQPGALLFEAYLKVGKKDLTFYDYIKCIGEDMNRAVDECIEVATRTTDTRIQKAFMEAASLGKARCVRYDHSKFAQALRILRVLNALRKFGIDMPYDDFKINLALDRLLSHKHWPLAIEICNFMDVPMEEGVYRVLADWCLSIMEEYKQNRSTSLTENKVAQKIFARLEQYPLISYADIAEVAARNKLPGLATILLDKEVKVSRQVTVLLKLDQTEKALQKAVQSQQPDLMHLVLRRMRETKSNHEIELLIRKVPQMQSLYQSHIYEEVPDRVLALYEQNDDFARQAIYHLKKAEECNDFFDPTKRKEHLSKAEKALHLLRDPAASQSVAQSSQLITENTKREERFSTPLADKTVRETFIWAAGKEEHAILDALRKQHKLGEKQSFCWTVEGLAQAAKWQQLEQFVRTKRSPVGYLPIIEVCHKYKNRNFALKLVDRLGTYEEQMKAYMLLGEVNKAVSLATEKLDKNALQNIRRRVPINSGLWIEVTRIMQSIH